MWRTISIGIILISQLQPAPPYIPTADQEDMYSAYAEFRLNNGLFPQILSPELCELAQKHSVAQAKSNKLYHSNYKITENVGRGGTPKGSIQMWITSPGHKRNLLSKYKYVGFGYAGDYATSLHSDKYDSK